MRARTCMSVVSTYFATYRCRTLELFENTRQNSARLPCIDYTRTWKGSVCESCFFIIYFDLALACLYVCVWFDVQRIYAVSIEQKRRTTNDVCLSFRAPGHRSVRMCWASSEIIYKSFGWSLGVLNSIAVNNIESFFGFLQRKMEMYRHSVSRIEQQQLSKSQFHIFSEPMMRRNRSNQ